MPLHLASKTRPSHEGKGDVRVEKLNKLSNKLSFSTQALQWDSGLAYRIKHKDHTKSKSPSSQLSIHLLTSAMTNTTTRSM